MYTTLAETAETEIVVLNSRFIAAGGPVSSLEAAEGFLAAVRQRYPDATHHCYAFKLLGPPRLERFSDDGEPNGTAGRPIHTVLDHQLSNAIIVVTRYFGGTKLGKGGLVKAYTQAAQALIAVAGTLQAEPCQALSFNYPYELGGKISYLLEQAGLSPQLTYSANISATVEIPDSQYAMLLKSLNDFSNQGLQLQQD